MSRHPNVRLHRLDDVVHPDSEAAKWRSLDNIVACDRLLRQLNTTIQRPLRLADSLYKRLRLSRLIVLCGCEGSGKRTVVRAYCRQECINLCELSEFCGTIEASDVEDAYRLAREHPPCVVMLVDASFATAETVAVRTLCQRIQEDQESGTWTILTLQQASPALVPKLRQLAAAEFWLAPASYSPPVSAGQSAVPRDNFAERALLLDLLLNERAQGYDGSLLSDKEKMVLQVASHNTTPRQLEHYLNRVFESPLSRCSTLQELAALSKQQAMPEWEADFLPRILDVTKSPKIVTPQQLDAVVRPYELHKMERAGTC